MMMSLPFAPQSRPPRTRRSRAVATAVLLAPLFCWSGMAAAQSPQDAYRVGAGDVLEIVAFGQPELTGRYAVAPDGTISYPLLGSVAAAGETTQELGRQLGEALSLHVPGVSVTATIGQYAPVFVLGDVQTPGRYEYRPGMIALELVAIGGGVRRATPALDTSQMQLVAVRQEYADLDLQIFALEVKRQRIEAEFSGADFAPEIGEIADPLARQMRQRTVDGEKALFELRRNTLAAGERALSAQETSYGDEIEKITSSMQLQSGEIDLMNEDVAAVRQLVERGLTARSNLRETERRLSSSRRDALELGSFLARAEQNRLALGRQREELAETRKVEAATQIQEIDLELARMRGRQRSLLDTMAELMALSPGSLTQRSDENLSYIILRMADGEYTEIGADERALLKPGDILRANFALPAFVTGARAQLR